MTATTDVRCDNCEGMRSPDRMCLCSDTRYVKCLGCGAIRSCVEPDHVETCPVCESDEYCCPPGELPGNIDMQARYIACAFPEVER